VGRRERHDGYKRGMRNRDRHDAGAHDQRSGMGGLTPTIAGTSQTASHRVTQTYTVPTSTVTTPGSTQTKR
jgi:hypothetical protein